MRPLLVTSLADDPVQKVLWSDRHAVRLAEREPIMIDVLYGDQEGGQRTISRFTMLPAGDDGWYALVAKHWDRPDPR
jgi:hypothetical protein